MELPEILKVGGPLPQSMGRAADLYHDVREMRLAMEKEVAEIKARENEIQEHLINNLTKGDDTGAAGLKYRAQIVTQIKYRLQPDGWDGFTSWMNKHGRFDMIQKRLNDKAVSDYVDETGQVLGYWEKINVPTVSITKI